MIGRSPGLPWRRGPAVRGARRRGSPAARRRWARRRPPSPRTMLLLALVLAVLAGGWMWLRDSSLVAVQRVRVAGASGPDADQIRVALSAAAHNMTTLDVKMNQLRMAVAPYPVVKGLEVETQFPHGMRIRVIEQVPVAIVVAGGRRTAVSGDGTVLHDVRAPTALPTIALGVPPGGTRVTGATLSEVRMLGAAPYQLLAKVTQVSSGAAHGLVAQLRNGPAIYFGDASQLRDKWAAAALTLAGPESASAVYIDVTYPSRPAAGALGPASGTAGTATNAGAATATGATGGGSTATTSAAPAGTASAQTGTTPAPAGG